MEQLIIQYFNKNFDSGFFDISMRRVKIYSLNFRTDIENFCGTTFDKLMNDHFSLMRNEYLKIVKKYWSQLTDQVDDYSQDFWKDTFFLFDIFRLSSEKQLFDFTFRHPIKNVEDAFNNRDSYVAWITKYNLRRDMQIC